MEGWRQGSVRTPEKLRAQATIKTVQELIPRNPVWKKIISGELNKSIQTMSSHIRDDQHRTVPHLSKGHIFNPALKAIRSPRAVACWEWELKHPLPGWACQNNRIYAQTSWEVKEKVLRVQGGHHASYVMVWWGIPSGGDIDYYKWWNWCPSVSRRHATKSCETS